MEQAPTHPKPSQGLKPIVSVWGAIFYKAPTHPKPSQGLKRASG